ncbi:hypothetical protein RRG08_034205 [Elysia crispata]|uniref:Uncharacterized protein n=1 Tax=Elysia crispata TaxID=231223 RepID=A0AAE1A0Z9_9GAST|nr:hypothetical protein RRG08_034205 [Elysia crispata]
MGKSRTLTQLRSDVRLGFLEMRQIARYLKALAEPPVHPPLVHVHTQTAETYNGGIQEAGRHVFRSKS